MVDPNHRQPRLCAMARFTTGARLQMGWRFAARRDAIMATGAGAIGGRIVRRVIENHPDCT